MPASRGQRLSCDSPDGIALARCPGDFSSLLSGLLVLGDGRQNVPGRYQGAVGIPQATHDDLAKLNRKVVVLCTAPDTIRTGYPSVDFDVLDGVVHRLKIHGIQKVVPPDAVSGWLDDHGGHCDNFQEFAEHFKAEYVIHIEVMRFTCEEENSPNLLRGQSEGHVRAYHLDGTDSSKRLLEVMNSDFVSTYPPGNPISTDKKSVTTFSTNTSTASVCSWRKSSTTIRGPKRCNDRSRPLRLGTLYAILPSRQFGTQMKPRSAVRDARIAVWPGSSLWRASARLRGAITSSCLGYLIGGPPSIQPDFEKLTKESLKDKGVKVAVVCFAPDEIRLNFIDVDKDMAKYVAHRLTQKDIKVVHPDRVQDWLDQHDDWDKPDEIGEATGATHVIFIDCTSTTSSKKTATTSIAAGRSSW